MGPTDVAYVKIIEQYESRRELYSGFLDRVLVLLKEFIGVDGVQIHSISGRIKSRDSLLRKLQAPGANYQNMVDIPDIAGIRVITYFEEEVSVVAEIIQREFKVFSSGMAEGDRVAQANFLDYTSQSFLVGLLDNRLELIEYKRYKNCWIEMQVRSVLQNAWAEINQQLDFPSARFPKTQYRPYSRVVALLELADGELNKIMGHVYRGESGTVGDEATPEHPSPLSPPDELRLDIELSEKVMGISQRSHDESKAPKVDVIEMAPSVVEAKVGVVGGASPSDGVESEVVRKITISAERLEEIILYENIVHKLDRSIADVYDTRMMFVHERLARLIEALNLVEIYTDDDLIEKMKKNAKYIQPVAVAAFGDNDSVRYECLSKGVSILGLCYVLTARSGDVLSVDRFIKQFYFENKTDSEDIAPALVSCYKSIKRGV